jgi:multiple sugar transport system ATP-binding protein
MVMARVLYNHVTKRFGEVVAVNNLTMEIHDKEFLVIVGPSGSGKSISLRMLAGLEEIDEGEIWIGDRIVNDVAPKDRDIAMVFQSYALYPHMSVADNMSFGLKLRKMPKPQIEDRVKQAAESLGIGELLDRRPKQLSGGQRQRVAVGRAIVRQPQVFLMDEPLSNLDAKLRVEARTFITKLHMQLGTTFIYVTHDQVEAMTMADRIAVLDHGILQQLDTPHNLYHNPCNLFVAGFIGSPAMNFINAKVRREDGRSMVETEAFRFPIPQSLIEQYRKELPEDLVLGIRPEDVDSAEFPPPDITPLYTKARVENVEIMGHETVLELNLGGQTVVGRTDPRVQATAGNDMDIVLNVDNLHLFDAKTKESIGYAFRQRQQEQADAAPAPLDHAFA